jgi:hypothetical protein
VALAAREETAAALGALEPRVAAARRGRDGLAHLLGRLGDASRTPASTAKAPREGLHVVEAALQELVREGEDAATSGLASLATLRGELTDAAALSSEPDVDEMAPPAQRAAAMIPRGRGHNISTEWQVGEDEALLEMQDMAESGQWERIAASGQSPRRTADAIRVRWIRKLAPVLEQVILMSGSARTALYTPPKGTWSEGGKEQNDDREVKSADAEGPAYRYDGDAKGPPVQIDFFVQDLNADLDAAGRTEGESRLSALREWLQESRTQRAGMMAAFDAREGAIRALIDETRGRKRLWREVEDSTGAEDSTDAVAMARKKGRGPLMPPAPASRWHPGEDGEEGGEDGEGAIKYAHWTAEEDQALRNLYKGRERTLGRTDAYEECQATGNLPGRTADSIYGRWRSLGYGAFLPPSRYEGRGSRGLSARPAAPPHTRFSGPQGRGSLPSQGPEGRRRPLSHGSP